MERRFSTLIVLAIAVCLTVWSCAGRGTPASESDGAAFSEKPVEYLVVVKEYGNLRAADSGRSAILRKFPQGTRLLVLTRDDKWYQVLEEESNALGWIHETYVKEVEP
jgi:hypothetical protein